MKKFISILGVLLVSITIVTAQVGSIKGKVIDKESGVTLPGAHIHVFENGVQKIAVSDAEGNYIIRPLKTGIYTVHINYMGYQEVQVKNVNVTSDEIAFVDGNLNPGVLLKGIEIVDYESEKKLIYIDEPGAKRLTITEITNSAVKNDPIKMLGTFPDLKVTEDNQVMVRGARPQSTQYYVDGVRSIQGGIGIPGAAIGSMKVYTSGVPAMYGDVSGGVIVVETKSYFDLLQYAKR